jgi:hypothetical protein
VAREEKTGDKEKEGERVKNGTQLVTPSNDLNLSRHCLISDCDAIA